MFNQVTNICRCCLGLDGPFSPIYEKQICSHGCLADMLDYTLVFKTTKNDGLSQVICQDCKREINRSYAFKLKCEKSHKLYRQIFNVSDVCQDEMMAEVKVEMDDERVINSTSYLHEQNLTLAQPTAIEVNQQPVVSSAMQSDGFNKIPNQENPFTVDLGDSITIGEPQLVMDILNATAKSLKDQNRQTISNSFNKKKTYPCYKCQKVHNISDELGIYICDTPNESLSHPLNKTVRQQTSKPIEANKLACEKEYTCSKCQQVYNSSEELRKHTCNHFDKDSSSRSNKSKSMESDKSKGKYSEYSCLVCGKKYQLLFYLQKHIRTHSSMPENNENLASEEVDALEKDDDTGIVKKQKVNIENDINLQIQEVANKTINKSTDSKLYHCSKCEKVYSTSTELAKHLCFASNNRITNRSVRSLSVNERNSDNHKKESYWCPVCGRGYQMLFYLHKHIMKSHKQQVKQTGEADITMVPKIVKQPSPTELEKSEDKISKNQEPDKDITKTNENINVRYSRRKKTQTTRMRNYLEEIKAHPDKSAHTKEKPHYELKNPATKNDLLSSTIEQFGHFCPRCQGRFATIASLKKHLKRNSCTVSSYNISVKRKDCFKKPVNSNTRQRCPYKNCTKTLLNSRTLKDHLETHEKKIAFRCSKCDMGFTRQKYLTYHMRRHTNIKPFKCPCCTKSFYDNSDLNKHVQIHPGICKYSCRTCGKKFFKATSLAFHQRVHNLEVS